MGIGAFFSRKKTEPTPEQLQATVPTTSAPVALEDRPVEQPQSVRYPVNKGDFFPLNGFMFQVIAVDQTGFACQVSGVTKKMRKKLDAYKAKKGLEASR